MTGTFPIDDARAPTGNGCHINVTSDAYKRDKQEAFSENLLPIHKQPGVKVSSQKEFVSELWRITEAQV